MAPECGDSLEHIIRKVRHIGFELLDVGDIAEQHIGINHIFVYEVEVVEQNLAPEVELVELLRRVVLLIYLI